MSQSKTGLILCDCRGSLKNLDMEALKSQVPEGTPVERVSELCNPREFSRVAGILRAEGAGRLVVAACSPWASSAVFGDALAEAGYDPGTALFVSLREQCSWAHERAEKKAGLLVAAALARAEKRVWKRPEPRKALDSVAVIGSGPDAKMVESQVASLGYPVTPLEGSLISLSGGPGDFTLEVEANGEKSRVSAGALVIATGMESSYSEEDHGLEKGPCVLSLSDLREILEGDDFEAVCKLRGLRVGFMVDVSAPDSVSTTSSAVEMAGILQSRFACEAYVFARDAKVAGQGLEEAYRDARAAGVVFIKEEGETPRISLNGTGPGIIARIPSLGGCFKEVPVEVPLDILVLDERVSARDLGLRALFQVGAWKERFFQEENVRLFPVLTNRRGIFVVGGARGDLGEGDTALDAAAVATEVGRFLKSLSMPSDPDDLRKAEVDPDKCARCLTCVRACPHKAISILPFAGEGEKRAAVVDEASCRGCGVCASICPAKAISYYGYSDEEFYAELEVMGGWQS